MTVSPFISVVLPTFNRAHTLRRAIHSVLNQSFSDLELIVIDDGSTDETSQVIATIDDPRLRYERRSNGGPAAARNTGLALARGKWACFQDSDDEWAQNKLDRQIQHMRQHPEAVLGVCGYLRYEKESFEPQYYGASCFLAVENLHRQTLKMFFYPTPTWIVRLDTVRAASGFDENLRCWEDWELALRLSERGSFTLLDEPLVTQYFSSDSVNSVLPARAHSLSLMLQRHERKWSAEPDLLFDILFDVGRHQCFGLSCRSGRQWFLKAAFLRSSAFRAWICWAASIFGPAGLRVALGLARRVGLDWRTPKVVW